MKWIAFIIGSCIFLLTIIIWTRFWEWLWGKFWRLIIFPFKRKERKEIKSLLVIRKYLQDEINKKNDEIRQLRKH